MADQVVSFVANVDRPSPQPDPWPWQSHALYKGLVGLLWVLFFATLAAAWLAFTWNAESAAWIAGGWQPYVAAACITAAAVGIGAARPYSVKRQGWHGSPLLVLWVAAISITALSAVTANLDRERPYVDDPAAMDHEIELCNARGYPPRHVVASMRAKAVYFCPDYERWFSYLVPWRACWDARAFEHDLAEIDRCKSIDKRFVHIEKHPARHDTARWWPGWSYVGRESSYLFERLFVVALASIGMAGFMEGRAVLLSERPGMGPVAAPAAGVGAIVAKGPTDQAFEAFASEFVQKDSAADTPSALLYLVYQLACANRNWPQYADGDAFGRKMSAWAREKHQSVVTEKSKGKMIYVGLNVRDCEITQQARRTLAENGGAA